MAAPAGHDLNPRDESVQLREVQALRLRAQGLTLQQIAEAVGYADRSGAKRAIDRLLEDVKFEAAEEYRQLELTRLEATAAKVTDLLYRTTDEGTILGCARELRHLSQSIRKLLGLDAPSRRIVEVITEDVIDAELRALTAEMAELARDVGVEV